MRINRDLSCEVQVKGLIKRVQAVYDMSTSKWIMYDQDVRVTRRTLSQTMRAFRAVKNAIIG